MPSQQFSQKIATAAVLGIDPGTKYTGYAVAAAQRGKFLLLKSGVWSLYHCISEAQKLHTIQTEVKKLLTTYDCRSLAMEAAFYGKNAQTMLKLGRIQGVLMSTAEAEKIPVETYAPKTLKQAIAGHGNAEKEVVARRIWMLLNQPEKIGQTQLDESDAIAVALCHLLRIT